MHLGPTQLLVSGLLSSGHLHQGRAAQEHFGLVLHHDGVIAHGREVGAPGRRTAKDDGDGGDAHLGEPGQVAKPLAPDDEDLGLVGEVSAARLDQIDQGKPVLPGDVHDAKGLGHRVTVHRSGLAGWVVGEDGAFDALDHPDPGHHVGAEVLVGSPGSQGGKLEERGIPVEEELYAFPGQELSPVPMALDVLLATTLPGLLHELLELGELLFHGGPIDPVFLGPRVQLGGENLHERRG